MNKRKFIILSILSILLFILGAFILSSCQINDGLMDATLTQEDNADLIEKYRRQNQENLDKIREYDLKEQDKYNGKTNFESNSKETSLTESQKQNTNPTAPSFGSRTKDENSLIEDKNGDKLDHWLYYDAEENEWGDAYYYIIKTKDGRENYEYAYSMLNGKKKIYDRLNGSRGQVIIVPEDYKVPADIQKWADDRFITIIHMPDSEFDNEYIDEDALTGQTFEDPYDRYEYYNSKEAKDKVAERTEIVRDYFLSLPITKIDLSLDGDYISNARRRIENMTNSTTDNGQTNKNDNSNNESSSLNGNESDENSNSYSYSNQYIKDRSTLYVADLIDKYGNSSEDLLKLAKSEKEKEEIQYIDLSTAELSNDTIELFSNIGYQSELVVLKFNGQINKIMKRSEAHKAIEDMFKEKLKIVEEATTNQELKLANVMTVSCPSAREFDINTKISKLYNDFSDKYREKSKIINKLN